MGVRGHSVRRRSRAHDFLRAAWKDELPTLEGAGDLRPLLAARLRDFGCDADVDELLDNVWFRIEVEEQSLEYVAQLKRAGYGVHVGTNQDQHRAAYMQRTFPYDSLFDTFFSSHALGVSKPDPRFFGEIATRIRCEPFEILFVDDSERNVDAARESGLSAFRWTITDGHDVLVATMERYGVRSM